LYKKPDPSPVTLEATLLWKLSDKLVAMDARGFFYTWFTKSTKQLSFKASEGDIVYVHADEHTRDVFHMTPKSDKDSASSALEGDP
jgi:hypothetical protein